MTLDSLQRAALQPRIRRTVLVGAGIAAITFTGLVAHHLLTDGTSETVVVPLVTPVIAPVTVEPPAVTVTVPPPPAPSVPDEPIPPPPEPPRPRALAPTIDAACALVGHDGDPTALDDGDAAPTTCDWDHGFPAISADGSTIVTWFVPDDGGRGFPGLSIHFIDTRTSKITRDALVLSPDEYDPEGDRTKLLAKMHRRAAAIQRAIDAKRFRSLQPLGVNRMGAGTVEADPTRVHAQFAGEVARIVDPVANTVLWRHDFTVRPPRRTTPAEQDMCGGWGAHELVLHHDPATGHVLATTSYQTGGCMCPTEIVERVARMPVR